MKSLAKFVLPALAAVTLAGCAFDGPFDGPRTAYGEPVYSTVTASDGSVVYSYARDTYIPRDGTAPYRGVDPYGNHDRFRGPANPE
jgi:hypothetical protein